MKITFKFKKIRTTKKVWEDAICDRCVVPLWESGKVTMVYVHDNDRQLYIQLCENCYSLLAQE